MKKLLSCLVTFLFSFMSLYGQNIKGVIIGNDKNPVPFAAVIVKDLNSNQIKCQVLSDTLGQFECSLSEGIYEVQIAALSYEKYKSDTIEISKVKLKVDLNPIILKASDQLLKEVVIKGRQNLIELKNDMVVMNIANSPLATGMTVAEALQFAPGVDASSGSVKILGRQNTEIWINGKPSKLNLNNIPTDQIQRIEIIQNASVKYDASTEGIINVVLKEWTIKGINGQLYSIGRQGVYAGVSSGGLLNYTSKKAVVYLNVDAGNEKSYDKSYFNTNYFLANPPVITETYQNQVWTTSNIFANAGIDWKINNRNQISISGEFGEDKTPNYVEQSKFIFYNQKHLEDSTTYSTNDANFDNSNIAVRLNYTGIFDSLGKSLDVSLESMLVNNNEQHIYSFDYFMNNSNIRDERYRSLNKLNSDVFAAKINYTQPLSSRSQLQLGAKISNPRINSNMNYYYQDIDSQWTAMHDRHGDFTSSEFIYAGYVSLNTSGKNWSAQSGLRSEYTAGNGSSNSNPRLSYSYLDFFPSASLNYTKFNNHRLSVSYSRKIQRPSFLYLNPYVNYLGPYTLLVGSPDLKPQYNNNFNLTYVLKNKYNFILYYNDNHNRINQISEQYDQNKTTIYRNINYESSNAGVTFTFSLQVTKWLNIMNSINGFYQIESGIIQEEHFNRKSFKAEIVSLETVTLPKAWKIQFLTNYYSPSQWGIVNEKGYIMFTAALGKSLLNNALTISLKGEDIFKSSRENFYVLFENQDKIGYHRRDRNCLKLSVRYRFEKGKKISRQEREKAAEEEKSRIGK